MNHPQKSKTDFLSEEIKEKAGKLELENLSLYQIESVFRTDFNKIILYSIVHNGWAATNTRNLQADPCHFTSFIAYIKNYRALKLLYYSKQQD